MAIPTDIIILSAGIISSLIILAWGRSPKARKAPVAAGAGAGGVNSQGGSRFKVGDLVIHEGVLRMVAARRQKSGKWVYDIE